MFGSGWKVRSAGIGIVGLVVTGTLGGLGVAGALPAPAQSSLAAAAHAVGIDLIMPDGASRADRRADSTAGADVRRADSSATLTASQAPEVEPMTTTTVPGSEVAAEQAKEAAQHSTAAAVAVAHTS